MKRYYFFVGLIFSLFIVGAIILNKRKTMLIKEDLNRIHIGMSKQKLKDFFGEANNIIDYNDFDYIPRYVEKHYYTREINLYPLIKKNYSYMVIISIDTNADTISEIVKRE